MRRIASAAAAAIIISGCGSSGSGGGAPAAASDPKPAAPAAQPAAPEPKPAAAPSAEAKERVDDPSFELALTPSGSYSVGKVASFALSLTPRGEYHINQEYPIGFSLHGSDGLNLPKTEFKKADAATFNLKQARFEVPVTPQKAGPQRVEANVKFAVCTAENCVPDERTLALVLPVQ